MHGYLATICRDCDSPWVMVRGVAAHVHIALDLGKKLKSIDLIAKVKKVSSAWAKKQDPEWRNFYWQSGYGLFSFGQLQKEAVEAYVRNQDVHYRTTTFKEEFRSFLQRYDIAYDER
jgi:REP element-mobilizing transposase RayT